MWKLAIEDDQGNRTVVNLVRDEYSIGRAEENTVRLTERNISRHHAKLSKNGNGWTLVDTDSQNGCLLNGVRVQGTHKVEHGDLLQFGDYRLELVDENVRPIAVGPASATVPVLPKSQSLVGQPDRLVMLVGPAPGAEFPLSGPRLVLGRGEECDLPLNHSSVSRVHAEIHTIGDGRYEIIDRDSANGVRVNGVELKRGLLDARDTIELGDVVLKFIPAGEIYRPGVDDTQQITGSSGRSERPSPAPGVEAQTRSSGVPGSLKVVMGLLALGALVVLGMVALRGTHSPLLTREPATAPVDSVTSALAEVKALLTRGEIEAAHQKAITEIPAARRDAPEFREAEARWADSLFQRAGVETDSSKKRALLEQILQDGSVDAARRKRAQADIAMLDIARVDVTDLPSTSAAPVLPKEPPPPPKPVRPRLAPSMPNSASAQQLRDNPYTTEGTLGENEPTSARNQDPEELATSGDRQKVARAKAILQSKVNSGRATEQEVRMLKALCRQLGDTSCSQ